MPVKLLDMGDPGLALPEFVVLDASVILELTPDPNHPHPNHVAAKTFLQKLEIQAQQGIVKPILPLLAFEECYFKVCKRALTAYARLAREEWHVYYKRNPLTLRSIHPALVAFHQSLLSFPIEVTEPEDLAVRPGGTEPRLAERLTHFIDAFAVLPKDATIFSEAERLGIHTVATLDSDYSRADGFAVIMPRTSWGNQGN
jgi:predicted nucleic acid-binding protein